MSGRSVLHCCLLIFVALLLSGCVFAVGNETALPSSPIPTANGPMTVEGFPIINDNYWLGSPEGDTFANFDTYNNPGDADGIDNRWPVVLAASEGNLGIYIQGAAGEFGLSQTMTLNRGCYGVKLEFDAHIHDRRNPENHTADVLVYYPHSAVFQNLGAKQLPMTTTSEQFFVFYVDSISQVTVFGFYKALFGTPGDNSMVNLKSFKVIIIPEDYC